MPSVSATRRPRRRLSGSESFSGISTPSTLLGAERGDAQRRGDAGIDAARKAEHDAAPAQAAQHLLADAVGDARASRPAASRRSASAEKALRDAAVGSLSRRAGVIAQLLGFGFGDEAAADLAGFRLRQRVAELDDFGTMKSSRMPRAVADDVCARRASAPGSSATTALIAMPRIGSGTPTTAASRTPGSA